MQKLIALVTIAACLGVALSANAACAGTVTSPNDQSNCESGQCDSTGTYCMQCKINYQLLNINANARQCVARTSCNNGFSVPQPSTNPITALCADARPDATTQNVLTAPTSTATASANCNVGTRTATTKNFTASMWSTAANTAGTAGGAFGATPQYSYVCLQCPDNCAVCDVNSTDNTKGLAPTTTSPMTGCKTVSSSAYFLGPLDVNGLGAVCGTDPKSYVSTNNATACSACMSSTNCSAATCGTGYTYVSLASTVGMTNVGNVNLSAVPGVSGPLQGCYNLTMLNATISKSASTLSVAFAAVVAVVAAVFAF